MDLLAQVLITIVYLLILPVRLVRALLGHDRLRRRRPPNAVTYWIVRANDPDPQSYFSEVSVAEGRRTRLEGSQAFVDHDATRWPTAVLRLIARLYAPQREQQEVNYTMIAADREAGIPDEVYTLW